ncbi:TPA: ESPR domain-containing protein, partial [Stenotrophomonas maltophilia]|nr:ESPR domain-containing protein [Stenotrophomonas maltophilia]
MNRIYRRVWNRQLNALVVASELATGDSGGSAARDPRAFLLMPTTLALALLCALASGHAGASETNQSLRDLQALAAKYAQPMPVKVDAEVALATAARQAQSSPAISADARLGLQLNTTSLPVVRDVLPATVQVKLAANTAPRQVAVPALAADVRANVGLGNTVGKAAQVDASLAAHVAPGTQAPLGVTADARAKAKAGIAGRQIASIDTEAQAAAGLHAASSGSLPGLKASVDGKADTHLAVAGHRIEGQGQARATAAVTLPAKEELPGETHDRAISAAFDAGVAGKVRVQAPDGQEVIADRNLKLAGQTTVAAQNSALGVGNLVGGTVGTVGGALHGATGAVGSAVGGALNGTVGSVGGAVGGALNGTVGTVGGAVGGALNGTVGTVGGAVGGALNNTVGAVGGAVGGALNGTVGTVGSAVGGALNGTVGTVGSAVGGALNGTVGQVGSTVGGTLNNTVGAVGGALNGTVGTVGGAVGGALNGTVGTVGSAVGGALNNTVGA